MNADTLLIIAGIWFLIEVVSYVWIFIKAGLPGWKALIPIYNLVLLNHAVGLPGWFALAYFAPGVSFAYQGVVSYRLSKAFGQGGLVAILNFVGLGQPYLAFGRPHYIGPTGVESTAMGAVAALPSVTVSRWNKPELQAAIISLVVLLFFAAGIIIAQQLPDTTNINSSVNSAASAERPPSTINPLYLSAPSEASGYFKTLIDGENSLDSQGTTSNNPGEEIIANGQKALNSANDNKEREVAEYWIGEGYTWQNNDAEVLAHTQQAIKYFNGDPYSYILEAQALINLGQNQSALDAVNKAIALDRFLGSEFRVKALVLANLGQKADAQNAISESIKVDQQYYSNSQAAQNLANQLLNTINTTSPPIYVSYH